MTTDMRLHHDRTRMKRLAGLTTAEFMVSAGVMLGLTVLTFDVMVAGAKVSTTSANESNETQEARIVTDEMMKDASEGSAILSSINVPLLGTVNSSDETVIITAPAFDATGKKIANTETILAYQVVKSNGKKSLYKFVTKRRLGLIIGAVVREIVKEDLDDIEIRFGRMQTLTYDPITNSFPLPGPDKDKEEDPKTISIHKIRAPWANLALDTREKIKASGRVVLEKNAIEMRGPIPANSTIDVFFYVNPKLTKPNTSEMLANMLEITLETKKQSEKGGSDAPPTEEGNGGRTITTSTVLKNAS